MPPEPDEVSRTSHGETTRVSHVVGIGASAGGLEALEKLFASMPLDTGMAFVVVQHFSPDFESHKDQLLGRVTKLAVRSVTDGMKVERNTVYLIPPKMEMVISNGKLLLTERARERTLSHAIDQFLRSLARDAGRDAVAIILSGTGSDGSRGIADVRNNGGLVIAQEASTCRFDAMPVNAEESGNVHLTLPPDAIGQALVQYVQDGNSPSQFRDQGLEAFEEQGIRKLLQLLQDAHGIDFGHYKASTVGRRIQRRIELKHAESLEAYVELLSTQPGELNELYKDLLIEVTEFFRDPEAVQLLENRVIPEILAGRASDSIRIWVCGCATGEEAYSLAMLFWEAIERIRQERGQDIDFNLLATDAHRESLQYAAVGFYPEENLKNVSAARREHFFEKRRDGYHVKPHLRRMVVFAPHNVIHDPPFTQMDLVSCRNLLIYLRPAAQRKTLSLFHFALRPSGTLWLGPSESTGEIGDEFDTIDAHWKVFRKRRDVRLPVDMRLPTPGTQLTQAAPSAAPFTSGGRKGGDLLPAVYDALLSRLMPPSVLVNERFEIVHTFEGMSAYLRFPTGRPTANVLEVVYPEIKTSLAGALQHAVKENKTVRYSGMPTPDGDPEKQLRLVVEPIGLPSAQARVLLVTFDEAVTEPSLRDSDEAFDDVNLGEAAASRIETLEKELDYTRQNLQATIEKLETSNEELQATNEEMVASNEELQSTNEELHTVNAEHQRRLAELDEANADMENLLASTRVGVQSDVTERVRVGEAARASADTVRLLLDSTAEGIFGVNARGLCTFCNRSAAEMFGFAGPDSVVSKSIRPLLGIDAGDSGHPILESLETGDKVNRSDQVFYRADGSSFPVEYWSYPIVKDDEHVGVVITFVDSTERLRKERELREARRQADSANEAKSRFLASMSHELRSPLSAMLGYADILQEQLDDESVLEKVSLIRRNGGYLVRLLNDLLDLSAIEAGKFHFNRDTQPLQQWLDDIHDVMQMRASERGCQLRFEYPGPLPETITTDAARLRQVMVNLISNAIKFARQGEVVVTAEMAGDSPKAALVLSVRDNGIGIARDKLDRLFEPFQQADESIGRKYGGTGLGLSISRRLVESLGGEISVESEEGEGTTFRVSVPVAPAGKRGELEAAGRPERSAADPAVEPTHSGELGARVLIADDMQDIRFIARHFLLKAGCNVQLAQDGREALDMILNGHSESDAFDVVLMDMQMPELDGADVVKTVRDRGVSTPIVALTADAMKGMRRRVLEIGFDEYVEKPLDSNRLVSVVARLAGNRRAPS